jgi:N-acetylglucosaminyl-diphospho-decaprenol L-rhamnosyltransferase
MSRLAGGGMSIAAQLASASPDVTVVIVSWNVRSFLARCLAAVQREAQAAPFATQIVVVDNGSTDGTMDMLARQFPQVSVLASSSNCGFGAANNRALARCASRYALVLNPDTELLPGALAGLVAELEAHPDAAVCGPLLLNADGSVQSSRRRLPRAATGFVESTLVQRFLPHLTLLRQYYAADRPDTVAQEVDWVTGAAMLVRMSAARQVGLFDEGFFMFSEELDWCWRFRRAGWTVRYTPAARIIHYGGQSTAQVPLRRQLLFLHGKYRLYRKYFGRALELALRGFIFGTYVAQLLEEAVKLLYRVEQRSLRAERVRAFVHILRWHVQGSPLPVPRSVAAAETAR